MTTMFRTVSQWTGFSGAPGYTNLFFEHADPPSTMAAAAAVNTQALWQSMVNALPIGVTITVSPIVDWIEDTDGTLVDSTTVGSTLTPSVGTASGVYAAPSGLVIDWKTTTIYRGSRTRGRTFIVPIGGSNYQADGTLASGLPAAMITHSEAFRTASGPTFGIWARPQVAHLNHAGVSVPATPGQFAVATGSTVPDKVVVLRSRRD